MPKPRLLTPPPARILLIRPSALGDVCRTVPCLVSIRQAFADSRIDWLVNDGFAPAVASHPALSAVVPFHRKDMSPGRAWALTRRLRAGGYDLAIDLQGLLRSGILTWMTGAGTRVGYANARECAAACYNQRHSIPRTLHAVDRMLALLEAQGIEPSHDMRLHPPPEDRAWAQQFIEDHALTAGYTCIAPTAQWRCKCWPIERYTQVARELDGPVVVLAAPHEHASVKPLLDALAGRAVLPRTSVGQFLALIAGCKLLVCNDSAALHAGVAFGRRIASVFGPTDPALVGPYRRPDAVVQPPEITPRDMKRYRKHRDDQSLIARVSVERVMGCIQSQLDQPAVTP